MENNACGKEYPKKHAEAIPMNNNGYPEYRRRQSEFTYIRNIPADNTNVFTYNEYLLMKCNCYFNVRGARAFNNLKTVDNITYSTFEEAARARNLLQDDSEWMIV